MIKSYCKINLSLRVLKKLKNGLHDIQSNVFLLNLFDQIKIKKTHKKKDLLAWRGKFKNLIDKKKNSIITIFCMENFKDEMLKANLNYDEEIAKDTCNCYLDEFSKSASHQKAINKCKLETKRKFNL